MASAVWNGDKSRKLKRKANRTIFERPQKPASPAIFSDSNLLQLHADLPATQSSPHFVFPSAANEAEEHSGSQARRTKTGVAAELPTTGLSTHSLQVPRAGASAFDLLRGGEESAVSLLGDGDLAQRSPGLGKNWRQMQVS